MKAWIFDFNGTMLDDMGIHKRAWRRFLRESTGHELTDEEFLSHVCGPSNVEIMRRFLGIADEREALRLGEEKERIYREMCAEMGDTFCLMDGLAALLDRLKARSVPLAIATGAGIANMRFCFERLRLGRWLGFDRVVYEDGSFPGKPHPATSLRACAALQMAPEDCVAFEDTPTGIASAHAAGIGEILALATSIEPKILAALPGVSRVIGGYREIAI